MRRSTLLLIAVLGLSGTLAFGSSRASQLPGRVLGVLRTSPEETAAPMDVITVTFDRPVAGGLDETVDPKSIFSIEPAVAGRVEWRDPVTLRFTPAAPLPPGAEFRVRIGDDPEWFRYMGATGNDTTRDLRRVVELAPVRPLPPGCDAELVIPASMDSVRGTAVRWAFATYGPFRVVHAWHPGSDGELRPGQEI